VAKAVEATGPLLARERHRLDVSVPAEGLAVDADEVRLTQVVSNLLSNAAQFTPSGGVVTVVAEREGDDVVVRVRDTGMGIDAALLPRVFEMFVQGERSPDRADGGLGLGLSLASVLVELHGGTVIAKSEGPGRGSEFVVRLPASVSPWAQRNSPSVTEPAWARADAGASGARVLVVDDNRDVANSLYRLLSIVGYQVRTAHDASAALEVSAEFQPRIAILDIGLPGMDGCQLGQELRALHGDDPPTLIALTGYTQERDRERSQEAGFALHLEKPVDAGQLLRILETVLARGSMSDFGEV
jgi:CheY-like chemotaxis protein